MPEIFRSIFVYGGMPSLPENSGDRIVNQHQTTLELRRDCSAGCVLFEAVMDNPILNGWHNETGIKDEPHATRFFVMTGGQGGWVIYREGEMTPVQSHRRKSEAVDSAKLLARHEAPGEVLVEQKDGSFKACFACESALMAHVPEQF